MTWSNIDPRNDIYWRKSIVILRPSLQGHNTYIAGTGYVDTKHGYSITTSFEDHPVIDVWDTDWQWICAPD